MNTEIKQRPTYLLEGEELVEVNTSTKEVTTRPTLTIDPVTEFKIAELLKQRDEIDKELANYKTEIKDYIEATDPLTKVISESLKVIYKGAYTQNKFDSAWAKTQPWYMEHLKETAISSSLSIGLADEKGE